MNLKHYIDGAWREGSGPELHVLSPKTLERNSTFRDGGAAEVEAAASAARRAFPAWRSLGVSVRCEYVQRLADWLLTAYGEEGAETELKRLISGEVGKPLPEADIEVVESSDFLSYFVRTAPEILTEEEPSLNEELWPTKKSRVAQVPYGVVAIIKPWNYPLEMISWAIGPALLAGNTVVIKPSEKSPAVGAVFGRMAEECDFPPGVINVVLGGKDTGGALVEHEAIDMVSFTGSIGAGRSVAVSCAKALKKCSLELGGNDAAIVCSDCDLDLAANGLVWGAFCNAGQVCVGVKRAYVHSEIAPALEAKVASITASLRENVDVGPIVDKSQFQAIRALVEDAVASGAKVLAGGVARLSEDSLYFPPTVLADLPEEAKLLSEECFGPVLPLVRVESDEEAVRRANNSRHGLGASIWTKSQERGETLARSLNVGMVWLNDVNVAFAEVPWGGMKESGVGFELSRHAFAEYSQFTHLSIETGADSTRAWWFPY